MFPFSLFRGSGGEMVRVEEAVGGCRFQTHGVEDSPHCWESLPDSGTAQGPCPHPGWHCGGGLVPLPIPGLHRHCGAGEGVPKIRAPNPGLAGHRSGGASPYLRLENWAPPTLHAALPTGSRSPRQSSAQACGPPMLRPAPSARGPSPSPPPACRPRPPAPPAAPDAQIPVPSAAAGGRARGGGARSLPRPAPLRGPPPPALLLPTRKEPRGGRAPQPGGRPGAHLSLALCVAWSFWGRGASSEMPSHVLQTGELSPRATVSDAART